MKLLRSSLVFLLAVFLVAGCAKKKKEITSLDRKKAENVVSEAQFAMTLKDYQRAAGLFDQATTLCPDNGQYWVGLGSNKMKLGERDAARKAYSQALTAFQDAEKAKNSDAPASAAALQQVYVLALLGRTDDARELQTKLLTRYPNDPAVKGFVEGKQLDRLVGNPQFKALAL